jgi:hypothetical protein
VVPEGDPFLGYSAFGRIFYVFRCRGGRGTREALALNIALGVSSAELEAEEASIIRAFSLSPDHVMEAKELESVENGSGLLLGSVSRSIWNTECSRSWKP